MEYELVVLQSSFVARSVGIFFPLLGNTLLCQVVDDFDIRFQVQQKGGIQFLANTTMFCGSGSSCTQAQNAMPFADFSDDNNNDHDMEYFDGDNAFGQQTIQKSLGLDSRMTELTSCLMMFTTGKHST